MFLMNVSIDTDNNQITSDFYYETFHTEKVSSIIIKNNNLVEQKLGPTYQL